MSASQRRDEILFKRARLAELKRQRELREQRASQSTTGRPSIGSPIDVSLDTLVATLANLVAL